VHGRRGTGSSPVRLVAAACLRYGLSIHHQHGAPRARRRNARSPGEIALEGGAQDVRAGPVERKALSENFVARRETERGLRILLYRFLRGELEFSSLGRFSNSSTRTCAWASANGVTHNRIRANSSYSRHSYPLPYILLQPDCCGPAVLPTGRVNPPQAKAYPTSKHVLQSNCNILGSCARSGWCRSSNC